MINLFDTLIIYNDIMKLNVKSQLNLRKLMYFEDVIYINVCVI